MSSVDTLQNKLMTPLHSYLKASPFLHCYYVEPESPTMYIGGIALCDICASREHKGSSKVKEICYLAACSARWHGRPGTRAALWYLFMARLKTLSSRRYHAQSVWVDPSCNTTHKPPLY